MSKRIYVGNLPWSVGKDELEEAFSKFGEIEDATVITNKYTGRSRGFGFVTYKNDGDGEKAISEMNEKNLKDRKILVKEARPMKTGINASAGVAKTAEEKKAEDESSDEEEKSDEKAEESDEGEDESQPEKDETEDGDSEEKENKE